MMGLYIPPIALLLTFRMQQIELWKPLLVVSMAMPLLYSMEVVIIGYYIQYLNLSLNFGSISHIKQYILNRLFWSFRPNPMSIPSLDPLIYTKRDTGPPIFWCGGCIIILSISIFKFRFLFTVASSNVSSSRKLEYKEEEYHKWLQQWHFKRRSVKSGE